MRTCRDCGCLKPLEDFPVAIARTGTRRTRCFPCYRRYTALFSRADYQRHQQRRLASAQRYRADHAEAIKDHNRYNARQRRLDPEWQHHIQPSNRAHALVRAALKTGQLVRPDRCEQCGRTAKLDAAHTDYAQPLDVRWLCRSCHMRWKRAQPKLPAAHLLYFNQS